MAPCSFCPRKTTKSRAQAISLSNTGSGVRLSQSHGTGKGTSGIMASRRQSAVCLWRGGHLRYDFRPASTFVGDFGSLLLGTALA